MDAAALQVVPFEPGNWSWDGAAPAFVDHLGRASARIEGMTVGTVAGVELVDGVIETELAVAPERGFHGVVWRYRDDENFESFFVRPHQVGNPDSIQYTPVFNGISSWQLYHGPGFWAPVSFPLDEWFTIRVAFSGARAEVFVGDLDTPVLTIGELKGPVVPGGVGVFGGPGMHVSRFAFDADAPSFSAPAPPPVEPVDGIVPAWSVSDAFAEEQVAGDGPLDAAFLAGRSWTRLETEPSGLADLSRVNGIRDGRNTTFARATIRSERARTARLEFGFSDRALVYLNGRPLYRGADAYRSRDYRFLGSIGWYYAVYLPLEQGENDVVVAVSEDFGGWGVQARFPDAAGLTFA